MSLQDDLTELVAQPMIAVPHGYMSSRREMNIHDFDPAAEGGERLLSAVDSARHELAFFMADRGLRLAEPMEIRITVEVIATTEPLPEPDPGQKV